LTRKSWTRRSNELPFDGIMKLAQTTLSRRDSLKIARRFNAGNGSPCASSPALRMQAACPFQPSLRDSIPFATSPGVETPGYGRSSFRDKTAVRFGKLRRSDLFVENQSVQDSKLRRSGIFRRHKDVAPTELANANGAKLKTLFPPLGRRELIKQSNKTTTKRKKYGIEH